MPAPATPAISVAISVVCPFYNEAAILERAVGLMLQSLASLPAPWELVIVDDGSTDDSPQLAERLTHLHPQLRLISYRSNRGRGHALRRGVRAARGELVVTTEIDCSWGQDVVHRLVEALRRDPDLDIVIASPNLRGGGYRNVPLRRVLISRLGNLLLRSMQSGGITMYTGMTRGYQRRRFLGLPLTEDGKEQHLEILHKALAFGYRIAEVPAVLEWKEQALASAPVKRKSSTRLWKTIHTHLRFSALARPIRYFGAIGLSSLAGAGLCALWAAAGLPRGDVAVAPATAALLFLVTGGVCLSFGVVTTQLKENQRDLWRLQSVLAARGEWFEPRDALPVELGANRPPGST